MKISILALQYGQANDCEQYISKLIGLLSDNGLDVNSVTKARYFEDDFLIFLKYAEKISSYMLILNADKRAKEVLGAAPSDIYTSYSSCEIAFIDTDDQGIKLFEDMVLPVLISKSITHRYKHVLRTYGINAEICKELIKDVSRAKARVSIDYIQTRALCDIIIGYTDNMSGIEVLNVINSIKERLDKYLYAEGDVTLSQAAFEILLKTDRKISIAESYTGGRIVSQLVLYPGASKVLIEGLVTYDEKSKLSRLEIDKSVLEKNGVVSSETAYQMATGLIKDGADIAMATTGFAGPEGQNVGLCYLALGDKDGIHIFENHFEGGREQIILQGCDNAFFRLIQYLKNYN
ncbi:MAG: CinA family protein [Clostridiales bacterium]|nr:CinA family protein [Clostridiales bacterium]